MNGVGLNTQSNGWSTFTQFTDAVQPGKVGDRTVLKASEDGVSAKKGEFIGNIGRRQETKDLNNDTRTRFLNAVMDMFGAKTVDGLPPSVAKAMELNNFKTDENGAVITGRPLSARRVRAVQDAITNLVEADARRQLSRLRDELKGIRQYAREHEGDQGPEAKLEVASRLLALARGGNTESPEQDQKISDFKLDVKKPLQHHFISVVKQQMTRLDQLNFDDDKAVEQYVGDLRMALGQALERAARDRALMSDPNLRRAAQKHAGDIAVAREALKKVDVKNASDYIDATAGLMKALKAYMRDAVGALDGPNDAKRRDDLLRFIVREEQGRLHDYFTNAQGGDDTHRCAAWALALRNAYASVAAQDVSDEELQKGLPPRGSKSPIIDNAYSVAVNKGLPHFIRSLEDTDEAAPMACLDELWRLVCEAMSKV